MQRTLRFWHRPKPHAIFDSFSDLATERFGTAIEYPAGDGRSDCEPSLDREETMRALHGIRRNDFGGWRSGDRGNKFWSAVAVRSELTEASSSDDSRPRR